MKRILSVFLLLLSLTVLHAQETKTPAPALFKLEAEGTVMYFFGSVHVGAPDFYPLPKAVMDAYEESENLVVELDAISLDAGEMFALMQQYLMYSGGDSLDKHLPPECLTKLKAVLKEHGVPFNAVKAMKPAGAYLVLSELMTGDMEYIAAYGIDVFFLKRAHEEEKNIIGLETAEEQIAALGSIPENAQLLMLENTLDRPEKEIAETEAIVEAWRNGDIDTLADMVETQYQDSAGMLPVFEILFVRRNITMKDRLLELIKKGGTYFVVVGAAHFIGAGSVIDLLSQEGYRITLVESPPG